MQSKPRASGRDLVEPVPGARRGIALSHIRPVPRRGLSRDEAAMYIGVSAGKFDEMVGDGRMPRPVKIDSRKVWDILSLDLAFEALPREHDAFGNSWNDG
jgi:predicted DNA-binding transcriptional regulator AlpA